MSSTARRFQDELQGDQTVVWTPQPGSQVAFLSCPVYEVLYEGTRGPGKTDALIMDFCQDVGRGFGSDWRGILFRQTYTQLTDVIAKTRKWFPKIWPNATYNKADHTWEWPTGEQLLLRYMDNVDDYENYHGHEYPWLGWEELTNWPSLAPYLRMMACSRSSNKDITARVRSTTNPYGPGHNAVKDRWRLPEGRGKVITDSYVDGHLEPPRVAIHGHLRENLILLEAEPDYAQRVAAAARNSSEREAWLDGSWDVTSGGMFDDIFKRDTHVLPVIKPAQIPASWKIDRSFDWGSSKPFSVGWWAESSGEYFEHEGRVYGAVPGDLIRIDEWYGWNGKINTGCRMLATDIAKGILDRELDMGITHRVEDGIADASIFNNQNDDCVARDMEDEGIYWLPADKSGGSRKQGWEKVRTYMKGAVPAASGIPREDPGMFVTANCTHFLRTVPSLPRDDKDLDDVNTDAEDHIGDEVRYRARALLRGNSSSQGSF